MRTLLFFILLLLSADLFAQKCTDYYYMQNNKTIVMTIYNKKGKNVGTQNYTISDVKTSGGQTTSTVNSEFIDNKGKSVMKGVNNVKCQNGVFMMDIKAMIPVMQQQQMGDISATATTYLEYPSKMGVGDSLKNASFSMDFKMATGIAGHTTVDITKRYVAGKETVTTSAGTWDCFKITYHNHVNIKMMIGFNMNDDVTEWYAPGFGVVKTESDSGKTEITSIK